MSDKQPEEAGNSSSSSEDTQSALQRGSQESVTVRRSRKPRPETHLEEMKTKTRRSRSKNPKTKKMESVPVRRSKRLNPEERPEESPKKKVSKAASMDSQSSTSQTEMAEKVSLLDYITQSFARITKPRNTKEQEAASEIISQLEWDSFDGNGPARTIKKIKYKGLEVRVDIQGTFLHHDKRYVTVQVQINDRSVAGIKVLSDYSFGRQKINNALLESMARSEMATLDTDLEAASTTLTPNKWPTEMGGLSDVHVMRAKIYPPANKKERKAAMAIIHQLNWGSFNGNEPAGKIKELNHDGVAVRVDIQGTFPTKPSGRCVNVQVQIGNRSVAGIIVPGNRFWGRNRINTALLKSLTDGKIVTVGQDDIP